MYLLNIKTWPYEKKKQNTGISFTCQFLQKVQNIVKVLQETVCIHLIVRFKFLIIVKVKTIINLFNFLKILELLPSQPDNVEVEALTEKSLKVSWSTPISNAEMVTEYMVNVTSLKTFDDHLIDPSEGSPTQATPAPSHTIHVNVPSSQNQTILSDLTPFTMYEVTVSAIGLHGASLPSYSVRSLTLTPGKLKPTAVAEAPQLPDVKACCANKGIVHKTCINKLCDPLMADTAEITDLMICAPWAADTFGCLINGMDHTPCCKARGLPELCQQLCTGNVTTIDFSFFK